MKYTDIRQITYGSYKVNVGWNYLMKKIEEDVQEMGLDLNPDFQRGHVWTEAQQISYVEWILRGGRSGREILTNCVNFHHGKFGEYVLVDGKQRLTAITRFMNNEIPAFGHKIDEISEGRRGLFGIGADVIWCINDLPDRASVIEWYLAHNGGGTVHAEAELERVRKLLEEERKNGVRASPNKP